MSERTIETVASQNAPWVSPDGAVISVLAEGTLGKSIRLPAAVGDSLRVGKSSDNDLVLNDKSVSRHHFEIARTAEGLLVRDLGSRNGTFMAGVRVREAIVEPGSILKAGDAQLLVRVASEGAVVPPSASSSFQFAIGHSLAMRRIFGVLERVSSTEATVLLTGETGTGKDVLARSVHAASPRKEGPFEVVDCGAISPNLIESELFGHERGAFTGAVSAHEGAFERANGGTIFLDELGELPLALQPKLLRVLEAREIRRVGGKRSLPVDVRVIAATTHDLVSNVNIGTFRQDLYFRLAVVPIHVPPLRERVDDIPWMASWLLERVGGVGLTFSPEALAQLRSYAWPGNVRELRNVIERAAVMAHASGDSVLRNAGLNVPTRDTAVSDLFTFEAGVTYRDARARVESAFERQFVRWILTKCGGNVAAAAREVQMDRKYLADLVRRHGL